jgi:metal-responsive CopG/Arc/MetJ family transcriptional regulator
MVKKSTGIMLDVDIIRQLDNLVKMNVELGVTRSEVINAILKAFLVLHNEEKAKNKIKDIVVKLRKNEL